jgi:putative inorganic carbon (HCO3(-)) transporter
MSHLRGARPGPLLVDAALAAIVAVVGGALLVFTLNSRAIIALAFVGGLGMLLVFYLSGNVRLCCLLGVIFAGPLDLSKRFMPFPHFGGEWAVRIEATDIFIALLVAYWAADFSRGRVKSVRVPNPAVWWGAMTALAVLLLPLVFYRTLAVYEIIRMLKMILLAVVLANEVARTKQVEYVVAALFAGALIQSVYGIMQRFAGLNLPLEKLGQLSQTTTEQIGIQTASRVGAMLGHPNMLAAYLILILPLACAILFGQAHVRLKALGMATLLLGSMTLVLTLSRAAWFGYSAGLALCMAVSFLHPRLRYQALPLRVVAIVALAAIGLLLSGQIISKFTLSNPWSVDARWKWLEIAWKMIKAHPILGVGLNGYTFVFDNYDTSGIPWGDMRPPVHNIYALTWAEQGIIGLFLFAATILSIMKLGIKNLACKDNLMLAVGLGLWAGLCAVLVQGLADWTLRSNAVMRTFWTSIGVMTAIYYGSWQSAVTGRVPPPQPASNQRGQRPSSRADTA